MNKMIIMNFMLRQDILICITSIITKYLNHNFYITHIKEMSIFSCIHDILPYNTLVVTNHNQFNFNKMWKQNILFLKVNVIYIHRRKVQVSRYNPITCLKKLQ